MNERMNMEHWCNVAERGWKTCPSDTFSTLNRTWTGLGSNMGVRGVTPTEWVRPFFLSFYFYSFPAPPPPHNTSQPTIGLPIYLTDMTSIEWSKKSRHVLPKTIFKEIHNIPDFPLWHGNGLLLHSNCYMHSSTSTWQSLYLCSHNNNGVTCIIYKNCKSWLISLLKIVTVVYKWRYDLP